MLPLYKNLFLISFIVTASTVMTDGLSLGITMGVRGKRNRKDANRTKKLPTPPVDWTPYGPIRQQHSPQPCTDCHGRGIVRCNVCNGSGFVAATGHKKRNTVDMKRVIGSRWTSVETRCGHRQYTVSEMRGSKKKKNLEFRLSNCCGPEEKRVHLWIPFDELRSKSMWRAGWTTLNTIKKSKELNNGVLIDMAVCFRCKGEGTVTCDTCNGVGTIYNHHVLYD